MTRHTAEGHSADTSCCAHAAQDASVAENAQDVDDKQEQLRARGARDPTETWHSSLSPIPRSAGDRGQPHLANPDMMNWSRYLRAESQEMGCEILDTGVLTLAECLERLKSYL
jgi:hypothetical protein